MGDDVYSLKPLPRWLRESFFEDVVLKDYPKCSIQHFSAEIVLPRTENFVSVLHRVHLGIELKDGTTKSVSYITKSPPEGAITEENDMELFFREREMYENFIPKFEKIFAKKSKSVRFGPRTYKNCEHKGILILEDLLAQNFRKPDRKVGLDMKHAKAVLAKLAKVHAASVSFPEIGKHKLFDAAIFMKNMMPMAEEAMSLLWPWVYESMAAMENCDTYLAKLKYQEEHASILLQEAMTIQPQEFNVLVHGDLWSNNIMFQYDGDDITDVYFIDWQLAHWGSPAQDLHFFFVTSLHSSIRTSHYDHLVKYYYDELISSMKLLRNRAPPRLIEIQMHMLQRGYLGLNCALISLPAAILEPTQQGTLENLFDNTVIGFELRKKMYSSPEFTKIVEEFLPFFDNKGVLDL